MILMRQKTIADLKQMFQAQQLTQEQIEALKKDPRKGVQHLIRLYEKEKHKQKQLEEQFLKMFSLEKKLWAQGLNYVAGVDEAGRGPLAGPVVAAAVILPKDFSLVGINDSKTLSKNRRDQFYEQIKDEAITYHISFVHERDIDRLNILKATELAMLDALEQLQLKPDIALIDAVGLQHPHIKTDTIIKGDSKSASIAAASILAKVSRDRYMEQIDKKYPQYGFKNHKGYGTKEHLNRLKKHGISPIHRRSFTPVKRYITI